ncbi:MAG: hypothetical protein HFE45_12510 [Oscillospiraceae bacterium]|jgi:hypothetical protein|nr:hypothetical protein [Oscillospiraceae bacterium]
MRESKMIVAERALGLAGLALLLFPLFYLATTLHFVPTTAVTIQNLQYVEYEARATAIRDARFMSALGCTLWMVPACWMGAGLSYLQQKFHALLSSRFFAKAFPCLFYGIAGALVLTLTWQKEFFWFCSIPGAIFCGILGYRSRLKSPEKIFTPWLLLLSAGETVVIWDFFI